MFFLGGIIFWCLGIFTFREYFRLKFKNDLFLGSFFLAIGWLFPLVLLIPYSSPTISTQIIGIGATLLIPIAIVCLNLFVDFTVGDKITFTTALTIILSGFIDGLLISQESFPMKHVNSIYGDAYLLDYTSKFANSAFWLIFLICVVVIGRIIIHARRFEKKQNQTIPSNKESTTILYLMSLGGTFWVLFALLKQIFPEYLIGLDMFCISIFYLITLTYYIKKRELLYFLPGTLDLLIVIHRNGLHLLDYNFKTKEISQKTHSKDSYRKNNLRSLLYGITTTLQEIISEDVPADDLSNISFSESEVLRKQSKSLIWFLISHEAPSDKYTLLFNRYIEEIENECEEELKNLDEGLIYVSKKFFTSVQKKFSKIS
ncbi:hypothetical protein NEF87_004713 [Candidatus Lokiarchaeum ossiferum]|uniref:Histidine kinase N-terminal 7TM region domain-containing protein n=1 Tax=Candidatus Lokiarchaeum ossiferum TaxID=2951803 RepID=A0ABY6HY16_9ARCH|nr:hypothetical protein NEF87_004713 [Candidatus Lokiarchaeum sp. B-35]